MEIKKENKGKFTQYKKRTGKTTQEALHSDDPHVRKMANFARNAAQWKKQEGGFQAEDDDFLYPQDDDQYQFQQGGLYDYLHSHGRDNAQGYNQSRKNLAKQLGISNYSGTAQQNTQILSMLQEADKRGVSPLSLLNNAHRPTVNTAAPAPQQSGLQQFLSHQPNLAKGAPAQTYLDNEGNAHVQGQENTSWLDRQSNMDNAGKTPLNYRKGDNPITGLADMALTNLERTGASIARTVSGKAQGAGDYLNTGASMIPLLAEIPGINRLGKQGFQQLVKTITSQSPTELDPSLIQGVGNGIKSGASAAINEMEGMSPKIRDIYRKLNKAEIPFIDQRQANLVGDQIVQQGEHAAEATYNLNKLNMGNLPDKVRRIAATQNTNRWLAGPIHQQGGATKVDQVPDGFNPLRKEGNRQYYNKVQQQAALAQASGSGQGGADYDQFLQQKASQYPIDQLVQKGYGTQAGLQKYAGLYHPSEQVVYTEQNPQNASAAPTPAQARRGEPVYMQNKHIGAELFYPSRSSQGASDAGSLNTSQQSPHLKFRDDFGYTGEEADLSADEVQKYLGTTNTFQSPEAMQALRDRAKQVAMKQKGGFIYNQRRR